jgi:hypothetical protein
MVRSLRGRPFVARDPMGRCPGCQKKGLGPWRPATRAGKHTLARECRYCLLEVVANNPKPDKEA